MRILTDHGSVLADFIDWCNFSFLDINVFIANEMIIDFGKNRTVIINDHAVEVVHQFKYLSTVCNG